VFTPAIHFRRAGLRDPPSERSHAMAVTSAIQWQHDFDAALSQAGPDRLVLLDFTAAPM